MKWSLVSACMYVTPHASRFVRPTAMIGQPGSVAPSAYSPSPQLSASSYQIGGSRFTSKCGSQAKSAWPVALRAGPTAHALLPANRGKSASNSSASFDNRLAMRISRSGSKSMPSR
jgi:hypothetical protein